MKRICSLFLTLALVLGLCACGSKAPTWQEQYDLGVKYLSEGNYQEAIIAFTAAIEIDPKRAEAYVGRGGAYLGNGETAENLAAAQGDYQIALELDNTLADAWLGLIDICIRQEDYEGAQRLLEQALAAVESDELIAKQEELVQLSGPIVPQVGPVVELPIVRTEEDANGNITEYDETGKILRKATYLSDGTLYWEEIYLYDAAGLLAESHSISRYEPRIIDFTYDGLGRIISVAETLPQDGGIVFTETLTYRYDGAQVEITIDGSEQGTALPVWKWAVSYTMNAPGHVVRIGNRGYGSFVELTEYDLTPPHEWMQIDPISGFYGSIVGNAAFDGNGNQLAWSDGWYLNYDQHPEWRYNP